PGHLASTGLEAIDRLQLHVGFKLLLRFARERKSHVGNGERRHLAGCAGDAREVAPYKEQFGVALPTGNFIALVIAWVNAESAAAGLELLISCLSCPGGRHSAVQRRAQLRLHRRSIAALTGDAQAKAQPVLWDFKKATGRQID